jgi:hypothetical protein
MKISRSRSGGRLRIIGSADAGRQYLAQTGVPVLQAGPEPDRIDRDFPYMNAGLIGNMVSGWPYDGNALRIPHDYVPRKPYTVQPFGRMIDTGVTIPAIYVGESQT